MFPVRMVICEAQRVLRAALIAPIGDPLPVLRALLRRRERGNHKPEENNSRPITTAIAIHETLSSCIGSARANELAQSPHCNTYISFPRSAVGMHTQLDK